MSTRVPADQIEGLVGALRHRAAHVGRVAAADQRVYLLHSELCRGSTPDLRTCPYSRALDAGVDLDGWPHDAPVAVRLERGRPVPDHDGPALTPIPQ